MLQDFELADRLHSAAIHLLRGVRREDAAAGVGPSQLSALSVLVFGGPLTVGRLAEIEQVRSPTMTRIVTSLETAHLVTRESHPEDARATLITATDAGRALLIEGRRRRVGVLQQRISDLSATERDVLERALDALELISRGTRRDA
ncbi:MarR family winged helix-turn-helix transcriptional regulator [Solirubrobacter soli]|uniref:MarR family winged helix-turn-helix transcriptional regulator n=1 Tax=Solirubrobacter soli TaxID=363832 RepID=UPI0004166ADF|nr:MarR family transcriptional regulator [Solirubrobacter soli]